MCKTKPRPLIVELIAGAGVGKSTLTHGLMFALKINGVEAEYLPEVAKKLSWERDYHKLAFQPRVSAEQMFDLYTLCQDHHELDVIITDTSFLLGLVYHGEWGDDVPFENWITSVHRRFDFLTYNIERNPAIPYDPHGRNQNEEEAKAHDQDVREVLRRCKIPYTTVMNEGVDTVMAICRRIMERRPEVRVKEEETKRMLEELANCEALR